MSVVGLHAAAILVAQHRREEHAGGVEPLDALDIEAGVGQQELAADRAGHRVHLRGHHQAVDEVRQQQHVRVEREHPISARERDRLVLRGGESDVLLVVDHDAAILEALENVASAVGGGIVDDDHLQRPVRLLQRRFQAAADEPGPLLYVTTVTETRGLADMRIDSVPKVPAGRLRHHDRLGNPDLTRRAEFQ